MTNTQLSFIIPLKDIVAAELQMLLRTDSLRHIYTLIYNHKEYGCMYMPKPEFSQKAKRYLRKAA